MLSGTRTTCSYCGVGCGIVVREHKGTLQVEGDPEHPVNRGMLCSKGRTLGYTIADKTDRILYPRLRASRGHSQSRVTWDTALNRAANVFRSITEKYGPDSVGFYVSGQLLTEEYYIVNKLTKGFIGTNNIDTNSRLCMSSAVTAQKMAFGEDCVPINYEDIELADLYLIAGANPAWCHPILFRRMEEKGERVRKVVLIDPRKTDSASLADLHLQLRPGTDVALYNAIARILIEKGNIDSNFISNHTENYSTLEEAALSISVREAAEICDLSASDIEKCADWIADSSGFLSFWAMGLNQSAQGVRKNLSLINLHLITGHIGKPGSGPFSLTGQPNAMGGREVGGLATMLAAHRDIGNQAHREEVKTFWNSKDISPKPGRTATEMFDALRSGEMKAIWIACTNPIVSLPDSMAVQEGLEKARFVVVQDISERSETVKYADLVLPAAGWLEKEGTMTNSERRITYLPKLIEPPGEARPDSEIWGDFARRMGYADAFAYKSAEEIYAEHCALTRGTNIDVSGLSYDRLKQSSMQWPVPHPDHPGTPRLFQDLKFHTQSGRAKIHGFRFENRSEALSAEYPLVLTSGRIRDQWHTMTRTGKVNKLGTHIPEPYVEINPEDALSRGIAEGDLAEVHSKRGSVRLRARLDERIRPGLVFVPMHWGSTIGDDGTRANNVTSPALDDFSKQPDLKYAAVQVRKPVFTRRKVVIIGAGASAFRFLEEYRRMNQTDDITLICAESESFYNRILLPDVISGRKEKDSLSLVDAAQVTEWKLKLATETRATSIDRISRTVLDSRGQSHPYDILVLATGSRAILPPRLAGLSGVHTLRKLADAEQILADAKGPVVVLGGGVLGLETAGALSERGLSVTVIHRSSALMSRQVDATTGRLLRSAMIDRGIQTIVNDSIAACRGVDRIDSVRLTSGRIVDCETLICAAGTEPDIDLARDAGLACESGVCVDDRMQSSDPHIYAIGEAAEHRGTLYGTTLAAEDQGRTAARALCGDPGAVYSGSIRMNILKVEGVRLASIGRVEASHPGQEELVYTDESAGIYKKCVVEGDRLIGCILFGDLSEMEQFRALIASRTELGELRRSLLMRFEEIAPLKGDLVCSCNSVGKGNIEDCISAGITDFKELTAKCKAG
ncbi:MAG TPA: molybdopterin-dependent oxidoreductase, partial [Leptospiraceae bacterium]|nr:molybdopterin-dependent oxidoreductase [Leptospiraceae bacterium]